MYTRETPDGDFTEIEAFFLGMAMVMVDPRMTWPPPPPPDPAKAKARRQAQTFLRAAIKWTEGARDRSDGR